MKHNIGSGTKDQTVRFMIASSGIALGLFAKQRWLKALGFSLGGAELTAGIVRYSLLNRLLGRSTALIF